MATINASINISSDIMTYPININKSMTMKKAGSCHGLEETSGLNHKKVASQTRFILFSNADASASGASKVYVRNTGSSKTDYFVVGYGEDLGDATIETIGRLYGGDWMLIPWDAVAAESHDIYAFSSTAEPMTIEFMAFTE
tara:strand:+ start:631 stop:1053 length:423 start_codon:yes stop_codon:yes gene_type:complete